MSRDAASADVGPPVWAVGALLRALSDALQARFNPVCVRGEVSGFARAASGHGYFTLKDEQGQLRCAMFRRSAAATRLDWRDGQLVEVQGRLDVYGPRGDLQLIVEDARLAGQGNLYEQFLRLKATLEAEGLFASERKRPLPALPRSVGVVTSLDAAALRDVVTTLQRRAPYLPVWVFPSPVQGDAAPEALCAALERAYAHHRATGACEVLLLVRGGGSLEDLWAFNSPALVRKLAEAPMPVICGVGHETDFTLADFVADVRAPTPTAAAELCAPARDTLLKALEGLQTRWRQGLWRWLDAQAQRTDRLAQRLGRPSARLSQERQRVLGVALRLRQSVRRWLDRDTARLERWPQNWSAALARDLQRRRWRLDHLEAQLKLLDPKLVLLRGYALLTDASGHPITSVHKVRPGQDLTAQLADGAVEMTVKTPGS